MNSACRRLRSAAWACFDASQPAAMGVETDPSPHAITGVSVVAGEFGDAGRFALASRRGIAGVPVVARVTGGAGQAALPGEYGGPDGHGGADTYCGACGPGRAGGSGVAGGSSALRRQGRWQPAIRPHGDGGSSLPFVLLCFLIAAILVAGVTAASSGFLAQRDLQADCDGTAIAAASGVDVAALYGAGVAHEDALPLAADQAQEAADEYVTAGLGDDGLRIRVAVDADRVTVACNRVVSVPFGGLFGAGAGVDRSTVSTATSPLGP